MVDCPDLARFVVEAGPVLIVLATAMAVLVARELETTARVLGWSPSRRPGLVRPRMLYG